MIFPPLCPIQACGRSRGSMHISEEFRSERWAIIIIAVAVVTITVAVRAFVFLRYTTDRRRDEPCFPTLWLLSSVLRKIRILEAELVRVNVSKSQYFCSLQLFAKYLRNVTITCFFCPRLVSQLTNWKEWRISQQ